MGLLLIALLLILVFGGLGVAVSPLFLVAVVLVLLVFGGGYVRGRR